MKYVVFCPDENLGFIPQLFNTYDEAITFIHGCEDLLPLEVCDYVEYIQSFNPIC